MYSSTHAYHQHEMKVSDHPQAPEVLLKPNRYEFEERKISCPPPPKNHNFPIAQLVAQTL